MATISVPFNVGDTGWVLRPNGTVVNGPIAEITYEAFVKITIDGEEVTIPISKVYTKAQAQAYVNSIQAMINAAQ